MLIFFFGRIFNVYLALKSTTLKISTTLIVAGIFSLFLNLNAQSYTPMPTDFARWRAVFQMQDLGVIYNVQLYEFVMDGDTIIDSLQYYKIYRAQSGNDSTVNTSSYTYLGAMREDSNRKVYYRGKLLQSFSCDSVDTNQEVLLNDFSLKMGDSTSLYGDSVKWGVTGVDSIMIQGSYRTRWYLQSSSTPVYDQWLEGIGSLKGLFFGRCFEFEWGTYLSCFEDSSIFHSFYNNCFTVGINEASLEKEKLVFPNPSSGIVNFSGEAIRIFDLSGKSIGTFVGGEVDLSSYPKGMYFYIDERGKSGKFLLE